MDCGLVVPHDEVAVLPDMLVLARDCRYVLMQTFNELGPFLVSDTDQFHLIGRVQI